VHSRRIAFGLVAASIAAATVLVRAGQQGSSQTPSSLPLSSPVRERGSSLIGAYEGWYNDKDGSIRMLVGYFNRNTAQELDIPVGPNNRIEPGGPDQGQPTHFLTARQFGVFTIKVPKDFGDKKLTWTIVANGFINTITLHLKKDWIVEPYLDAASKNTPPVLKFQPDGMTFTGPPVGVAANLTATAGEPLTLTSWASDEGAKLNVEPSTGRGRAAAGSFFATLSESWSKFRGPGTVTFAQARPTVDRANGGKAETTATFSAPGEYVLRLQVNDASGDGGGGFQCCWTNAHVAVSVKSPTR
jgi:hypothetical protein